MKTKLTIGLSIAALALTGAGVAHAQQGHNQQESRDGTLTRAEAQTRATEMFARMDVNKDGKIDPADRAARQAQMFERIDTDKNGQISRDEFTAHHQRGPGMRDGHGGAGHGGEHGGDHAGMAKGDGEDHGKRWGGRGGRHGGMGGGMMGMARMADVDKDGAITQAEFTAAQAAHFDRIDANKDGSITREERQAARQAMRQQWRERRAQSAPQG